MILADEPTSSLDIGGIELLEEMLESFAGALMVVSMIGTSSIAYRQNPGSGSRQDHNLSRKYSEYARLKAEHQARAEFEYQQYVKEKQRLEEVASR